MGKANRAAHRKAELNLTDQRQRSALPRRAVERSHGMREPRPSLSRRCAALQAVTVGRPVVRYYTLRKRKTPTPGVAQRAAHHRLQFS